MYAGSSGCHGIVLYNTDIKGKNAVYGFYDGERICIEVGTFDEMKALKDSHDKGVKRASNTRKLIVIMFSVYLALVIAGFFVLPLKVAFAILVFCVLSYFPLLILINANSGLFDDLEYRNQFRRYHGCEHAAVEVLTTKKPVELETLRSARIYDPECGTAYSGYALTVALELALLIIFWPGILKAAGILVLTAVLIVVMILVPYINPFTMLQRPVVMAPAEREYTLAIAIMNKLRELE